MKSTQNVGYIAVFINITFNFLMSKSEAANLENREGYVMWLSLGQPQTKRRGKKVGLGGSLAHVMKGLVCPAESLGSIWSVREHLCFILLFCFVLVVIKYKQHKNDHPNHCQVFISVA